VTNTYILQELFEKKNGINGFTISRHSGTCRMLAYKTGASVEDVIDSMRYSESRGWIIVTSIQDNENYYSVLEE